jgi:hypothetical protein
LFTSGEEIANLLPFSLREIAVIEQIEDQQFGRIREESADQMTQGIPAGLLAPDYSPIDKGATFPGLGMPYVTLLFEDAKRGENGIVGEHGFAGKCRGDIPNRDWALIPNDIHEAKFGFGEIEGLFSRHEYLQQLWN